MTVDSTCAPKGATQEERADFLDALESYSDGYTAQCDRLLAAARRVADDPARIKNENAGFFLAKVMGHEKRFIGLTYDDAARAIIKALGNKQNQKAA